MKLIRFLKNDQPCYGLIEGEDVYAVEGSIFDEFRQAEKVAALSDVRLLAPCQPTKILAVGLNWRIGRGHRAAGQECASAEGARFHHRLHLRQ